LKGCQKNSLVIVQWPIFFHNAHFFLVPLAAPLTFSLELSAGVLVAVVVAVVVAVAEAATVSDVAAVAEAATVSDVAAVAEVVAEAASTFTLAAVAAVGFCFTGFAGSPSALGTKTYRGHRTQLPNCCSTFIPLKGPNS